MSEATLEQLVDAHFDFRLSNLYTCMVGVITSVVDMEQQRIHVQPIVNKVYKDGEIQEYPSLLSIPVQFPSSSSSALTFPLHQGDTVILVFSQKGLDVFKSGSQTAHDPVDMRGFDKRDAFAIPCVFPFGKAINNPSQRTLPHDTDDMVVAHNIGTESECEIRLKSSGVVEVFGINAQIKTTTEVDGTLTCTRGATGSFTTPTGNVVTVSDGIITNIF